MRSADGLPTDAPDLADVYELAMSALPDTVFLATREGDLVWVCPNVERVFGRPADAIASEETVASFLGPGLVPTALFDGTAEIVENVETEAVDDDGAAHDLLVTVRRLDDASVEGVRRSATSAGSGDRRGGDEDVEGDDGDEDVEGDDGNAERYLYACRDVSERVALRSRLAEVSSRITDSFFSVDTDFRVEHANEQFASTVGRSVDEIVGERLWDLIDDPERLRAFEILPEALESGEPTSYEGYYEPLDIWYDVNVYPSETGLSVYSKDVTERKRRERALAESERRLGRLFEGSLDAVLVADDEGRYLDANPAACELFGVERDDLLGRTAADFAPPGFDFEAAWAAFLDAGEARGEFPLRRPDGEDRVAEFAARAGFGPGEHLSILRDVTDRVERERLMEAQRDRLRELAELNEFVRGVNRDLVAATTPEEVYASVCRRFADGASFEAAAVVGPDPSERVEVVAAAGVDPDAIGAVDPLRTALVAVDRRGEGRTVEVDADAAERLGLPGPSSLLCLPITAEGASHGVLVVVRADGEESGAAGSADEEREAIGGDGAAVDAGRGAGTDAESVAQERSLLLELAETVGMAVGAVTTRRLFHAETVVRVDVATRGGDDLYDVLAAASPGTRLAVVEIVPIAAHRQVHYLRVTGGSTDAVVGAGREQPAVERVRTLSTTAGDGGDGGDGGLVEVVVSGGSLVGDVLEGGGRLVRGRADGDRCEVTVELPPATDVGRFVRTLRRAHPGIELVGRRTETVAPGRDDRLDDGDRLTIPLPALTDRQRAALTAAHAAGYYDWPTRGTTAAELAESFGLSGSTFGQHLRVATGKLVAAFVDAT